MADRILKPDSGNDLVLQNDDASAKIEINEDGSIPVTGTLAGSINVSSGSLTTSTAQKQAIVQAGPGSGTLDVSSGTFTTSTAQKQAIVQAGPGSGTLDVSSGTFTTSTAQKQAIVQAGPGSGTLNVSSGTFTSSTAQKQAIVDGADIEGTAILSTGESGGSKFLREDGDGTCSWQTPGAVPAGLIAPFAMSSAPTGWLVCDGSSISTSTYSALHSAIGYSWGGSGSSFNIPDLRNAFLRGVGTSTAFSQNATTTLAQTHSDQFQGHGHQQRVFTGTAQYASGYGDNYSFISNYNILGPTTIGTYGTCRTGNETRPNSKGVQYMIKI